jgi:hypothetical protein
MSDSSSGLWFVLAAVGVGIVLRLRLSRGARVPRPSAKNAVEPIASTQKASASESHTVILGDGGLMIDRRAEMVEAEGARFICSGCVGFFPMKQVHVIPTFNDSISSYVTSFRCDGCWKPSLAETLEHFTGHLQTPANRAAFFDFFKRHGVFVQPQEIEDPAAAKVIGVNLLHQVETGAIVLNL